MHGVECNLEDLATTLIPVADGGILTSGGPVVEYVTGNVAPGVFVVVKSESDVITHELDYLKLGKGPSTPVRPSLASIEPAVDRRGRARPDAVVPVHDVALRGGLPREGGPEGRTDARGHGRTPASAGLGADGGGGDSDGTSPDEGRGAGAILTYDAWSSTRRGLWSPCGVCRTPSSRLM